MCVIDNIYSQNTFIYTHFSFCHINIIINMKSFTLQNVKLLAKDLSVRGQSIVCSNCCESVAATLKIVAPELLNVKENRAT